MPTLTCKQCAFENEAERIYCHNCGAKLDRSVLPTETAKTEKNTAKMRRRVAKMTNPVRGFFAGWQKTALTMLLSAVVTAGLIQAARPPDAVPRMASKDDLFDTPPIPSKLEDAESAPRAQRIEIHEDLINRYLQKTVAGRSEGALGDWMKFDRCFVNLQEGALRISTQQSVSGYPLYAGVIQRVTIKNEKVDATVLGGNLGRLPVHPLIMQSNDLLFGHLWKALDHERKLLDKLKSIKVTKEKVVLETKGTVSP